MLLLRIFTQLLHVRQSDGTTAHFFLLMLKVLGINLKFRYSMNDIVDAILLVLHVGNDGRTIVHVDQVLVFSFLLFVLELVIHQVVESFESLKQKWDEIDLNERVNSP